MLKSQLNDSAYKLRTRIEISNRLGTILPIARYISYGAMIAAFLCIVSGVSCDISSLIDVMTNTRLHGKAVVGATIMYPMAILGLGLSYLIPFVIAYIFHAIDVSLDTLKPDYQVSANMTQILIWGQFFIGIWGIILELDEDEVMALIFFPFVIAFYVVAAVWVSRLSQRWSVLDSAHKKTAGLLRLYIYLSIALAVACIIGYAIDGVIGDVIGNLISPCVDLYLFYKFGDCYREINMAYLEAVEDTDKAEDNIQEITNRQ